MTEKDLLIQEQKREIARLGRVIECLATGADPCRFCVKNCDGGHGCHNFELEAWE